MKEKLRAMLEALINENTEEASVHFHEYLSDAIKKQTGLAEMKDDECECPDKDDDDKDEDDKDSDDKDEEMDDKDEEMDDEDYEEEK